MTTQASGFTRIEGCDLCRAISMTSWYHEDDVCWIAECDVCDVPMVVWRWHCTAPPAEAVEHMRARLHEVATTKLGEQYVDDHVRNIPDHWHAHARPNIGVPPVACSRQNKEETRICEGYRSQRDCWSRRRQSYCARARTRRPPLVG